jgi:hypothetical protein
MVRAAPMANGWLIVEGAERDSEVAVRDENILKA